MTTVVKTVAYLKKNKQNNKKKKKATLELRHVTETETRLNPLETEAILMLYNGNEHLMNTLERKQTKKKKIKATSKSQDFLSALKKLQ